VRSGRQSLGWWCERREGCNGALPCTDEWHLPWEPMFGRSTAVIRGSPNQPFRNQLQAGVGRFSTNPHWRWVISTRRNNRQTSL
jgi:hypothetical protein